MPVPLLYGRNALLVGFLLNKLVLLLLPGAVMGGLRVKSFLNKDDDAH